MTNNIYTLTELDDDNNRVGIIFYNQVSLDFDYRKIQRKQSILRIHYPGAKTYSVLKINKHNPHLKEINEYADMTNDDLLVSKAILDAIYFGNNKTLDMCYRESESKYEDLIKDTLTKQGLIEDIINTIREQYGMTD